MNLLSYLQDLTRTVKEAVMESLSDERWRDVVKRKATDTAWRVDHIAERKAMEFMASRSVPARLVSEEAGVVDIGGEPEITVILDPLDGSLNFTRSIPFCSVSAAAGPYKPGFSLNDLQAGVVESLFSHEVFHAEKGGGAYKNNRRLTVGSSTPSPGKPLVSLYIHGVKGLRYPYGRLIDSVKVRALGSVALELCYIATSSLDAVLDLRGTLRVVDVAAGKIVLEEAGGVVKTLGEGVKPPLDAEKGFSMIAARDEALARKLWSLITPRGESVNNPFPAVRTMHGSVKFPRDS